MTQRYYLELIEEHDAVNYYSVHLDAEELSELERFFEKFPEGSEYDEERLNDGSLYIIDKELIGNLNFIRK